MGMRISLGRFLLAVAILGGGAGAVASDTEDAAALVEKLQAGGAVIYWRHAETDWEQQDEDFSDMSDCTRQRNLSAEGRDRARAVGASFEELGIPVDRVVSSPFCRTIETAELGFGKPEVIDELFNASAAEEGGHDPEAVVERLEALLTQAPENSNANTVIVGHNFNLQFAAGIEIGEGQLAVFRPTSERFRHLGNLTVEQLEEVAEQRAAQE